MESALKFVFVGDNAVGKTCTFLSFTKGRYPDADLIPFCADNFDAVVPIQWNTAQTNFKVSLWDTSGSDDYDRIRPIYYSNTNVFILCFSSLDPASFEHVRTKWVPELSLHCPSAKIILLATKIDIRDDPETIDRLSSKKQLPIYADQGEMMAREINAACYCECSALTQVGVRDVFETAVRIFMNSSLETATKKPKKECVIV